MRNKKMLVGAKAFDVMVNFQRNDQIQHIVLGYVLLSTRATLKQGDAIGRCGQMFGRITHITSAGLFAPFLLIRRQLFHGLESFPTSLKVAKVPGKVSCEV
jgi:hypothetical protein